MAKMIMERLGLVFSFMIYKHNPQIDTLINTVLDRDEYIEINSYKILFRYGTDEAIGIWRENRWHAYASVAEIYKKYVMPTSKANLGLEDIVTWVPESTIYSEARPSRKTMWRLYRYERAKQALQKNQADPTIENITIKLQNSTSARR